MGRILSLIWQHPISMHDFRRTSTRTMSKHVELREL